jgi:Sugar (and other) transporter
MVFSWIFSFSVFQMRTTLIEWFGNGGQMYFYAFCSTLAALVAIFYVPETAGKSFEEIFEIMSK